MNKSLRNFTFLCITVMTVQCNSAHHRANDLYGQREKLMDFKGIDIFRRGRMVLMIVRDDADVNKYTFERTGDTRTLRYKLTNADGKISTLLNSNPNLFSQIDSNSYAIGLENVISILVKKMDHLGIREMTSEFKPFGIDMKFYARAVVLLYVSDTNTITNVNWRNYLNQTRKLDSHWYFTDN